MVTKCVNKFSEPLKNILHAHGVSILLTDFKKRGCSFYIKITIDLLCKRIKFCVNVEETHGFQENALIADASGAYSWPQMFAFSLLCL